MQRTTTDAGAAMLVTRLMDSSFDLRRPGWTAHTHYEGNLPPDVGKASNLDMDLVAVNGKAYMTMPGWPSTLRGRWLPMASGTLPAGAPADVGGEPFPVVVLRALRAESVDVNPNGSMTITGRVGLKEALGLLGLQAALLKSGIQLSKVEGTAPIQVIVDSRGLPLEMTLKGRDVVAKTTLPSTVMTALGFQYVDVRFTRYGEPLTLAAPPQSRLIDPSEMGS